MSGRLAKAIDLLTQPSTLKILATLRYNGGLLQRGWFDSVLNQAPVDASGRPIPWMTYPFISFIEQRLTGSMEVFEFGSGNSTKYFAQKVRSITSVEHEKAWIEKISSGLPANATLLFKALSPGGEYCQAAKDSGRTYDIIIVDGRDRVNCIRQAIDALKQDGIMVLDDAQRTDYKEGISLLLKNGFRQISFTGMAPCTVDEKNTDVFYRPINCLNI